jgi:general stress protein 26
LADLTLEQLAEKLKGIDFAMLATVDGKGITARPMSNNGDVEYDGDAWFFTYEDSDKVRQIKANDGVSTAYQGKSDGDRPGAFISVEGKAEIITDQSAIDEHWYDELEIWFPDGKETEGVALIKVHASLIRWWDGDEDGEITVK